MAFLSENDHTHVECPTLFVQSSDFLCRRDYLCKACKARRDEEDEGTGSLDEAVIYGKAHSLSPRVHSQLGVDGGEVRIDRPGAQKESSGKLYVGEPFGNKL